MEHNKTRNEKTKQKKNPKLNKDSWSEGGEDEGLQSWEVQVSQIRQKWLRLFELQLWDDPERPLALHYPEIIASAAIDHSLMLHDGQPHGSLAFIKSCRDHCCTACVCVYVFIRRWVQGVCGVGIRSETTSTQRNTLQIVWVSQSLLT